MKRCQIGVGGRNALDDAHSIMADCYGTLGALMLDVERLRAALKTAISTLERDGDEWNICEHLRAALGTNGQHKRALPERT